MKWQKIKVKKSLLSSLRNNFIAGVVVLIPIGITLYLTVFIINVSSKLIPKEINPNHYSALQYSWFRNTNRSTFNNNYWMAFVIFYREKIFNLFESLLNKIPIIRTIYSAVEQLIETFTKSKSDKKTVVLIEYPRKGVYAVGFATKENTGEIKNKAGKELINVFVPTTPNPTSGFLLMFPKDEVIYLDLSFEEASKFIVSAGSFNP